MRYEVWELWGMGFCRAFVEAQCFATLVNATILMRFSLMAQI